MDRKRFFFLDCLLVFLLLCISGNPVFIYSTKWTFAVAAPIFALFCIWARKSLLSKRLLIWLAISLILSILQFLFLEEVSIVADINFLFRLFIAYFVCSFLGDRFRVAYFKVMVFVCGISVVFSFLYYIADLQLGINFDRYKTILIFNTLPNTIVDEGYRNAAMFWEPGALQGYIMLVPLLFIDKIKFIVRTQFISIMILLIALLMTKSTTAYVALSFFVIAYLLSDRKIGLGIKTVMLVISASLVFFLVWKMDFIGNKIFREIENAVLIGDDYANWTRAGSFLVDYSNIIRHPIIGNGHLLVSRYEGLGDMMEGAGNGLSGAINMFGMPFILFYFVSIFHNFSIYQVSYRIIILVTVILLLIGEYFLNYPMFWCLLFVKIPPKNIYYAYNSRVVDCT